jgi:hypothetical protein
MPWSVKKPSAAEIAPDWLQPYCKQFMQELARQGYARCSLRIYDRADAVFCSEVVRRGLRSDHWLVRCLLGVRADAFRKMHPNSTTRGTTASIALSAPSLTQARHGVRHRHRGHHLHLSGYAPSTRLPPPAARADRFYDLSPHSVPPVEVSSRRRSPIARDERFGSARKNICLVVKSAGSND